MQDSLASKLNIRTIIFITLSSLLCGSLFVNSPLIVLAVVSLIESGHLILSAPYSSCEAHPSSSSGIRVSAHREQSRILGTGSVVFVYSATIDKGDSWTEFMRFYPDESDHWPKCDSIRVLDEQNFWVWEGWLLGITHDGGRTWIIWEPRDSWPDWKRYNFHLIMDVRFDSQKDGIMYLDPENMDEASMIIRTDDGGKTWK